MQIRELLTDDDAVSPVIGVILMVAITVILAAVIAAFVLGLGDTDEVAPQVTFDYDYNDVNANSDPGTLTITVSSGDAFTAEEVTFRGVGLGDQGGEAWNDATSHPGVDTSPGPDSTIRSGDRARLGQDGQTDPDPETDNAVAPDFELELVWTSEDGDDSSILSTRSGPDA